MIKINEIPTPELDKLHNIQNESQTIGEFLDWLTNERSIPIELCIYNHSSRLHPCPTNIKQLLAEYFEIDQNKAEKERLALLKAVRENQNCGQPCKKAPCDKCKNYWQAVKGGRR